MDLVWWGLNATKTVSWFIVLYEYYTKFTSITSNLTKMRPISRLVLGFLVLKLFIGLVELGLEEGF